jgi:hypothetical protein
MAEKPFNGFVSLVMSKYCIASEDADPSALRRSTTNSLSNPAGSRGSTPVKNNLNCFDAMLRISTLFYMVSY